MKLDCKHIWDSISGYLDDSLSAEVRADVERHLAHCEICSAILDSTRNILVLTADDRVFELPVGFSERLHARLDQILADEAPQKARQEARQEAHQDAPQKAPQDDPEPS